MQSCTHVPLQTREAARLFIGIALVVVDCHDSWFMAGHGPWLMTHDFYLHQYAEQPKLPVPDELQQELDWARMRPGSQAAGQDLCWDKDDNAWRLERTRKTTGCLPS